MGMADFAVLLFFTLTGSLITFLLLSDMEKTGIVNIKSFYTRKILRIWPLYYLYLLLTIIIMGTTAHVTWVLLLYIFIIPNFRNSISQFVCGSVTGLPGGNLLIGHYWSLGVEEQFHAFGLGLLEETNYEIK